MKHQFITGHYVNNGNIHIYTRGEDLRRYQFEVSGFEPYSSVLASARVPHSPDITRTESSPPGIRGEDLKRIIYSNPNVVSKFRSCFGDNRWEDDIRFVRRLLIDLGITSGLEKKYDNKIIHYSDLIPVDFSLSPVTAYWDIECYSKLRIPNPEDPKQAITCLCFWDTEKQHYNSILLDNVCKKTQLAPDWTLYHLDSEEKVLQMGIKYLERLQPDILAEWGKLDKEYFPPRSKIYDIDTSVFRSLCVFNMIPAYKELYHKGSNRLKDVAYDEGIIDYLPPEVDFADLFDNDKMALVTKNKLDVEWIVKLDKLKSELIKFFWDLKNYAGVEDLQETTYHGMLVDVKLLRNYNEKFVLPSKPSKEEAETRKKLLGALIKDPPTGLFDNVAVIDFSRYYQNLLIGILDRRGEERMVPLRDLAQELQDVRDEYDKKLEEAEIDTDEYHSIKGVRDSVKYIGEAIIGYLGGKRSRWYEPDLFEDVIKGGRAGILHAEKVCERLGYKVLYYDTDGVEVKLKDHEDFTKVVADAHELTAKLNDEMIVWCKEHGYDRPLKLKVDRVSKRALYSGKKKRSAHYVGWEDGSFCDYLSIKGFEYIRRDSSLLTREVQREVFEHLLRKGMTGLKEYLMNIVKTMLAGEYSLREISLSKGIKKSFDEYKTKPDFIRGAIWANKYLDARIHAGDQVKMIYVIRTPGYPSTDVVCYLDEDIIPEDFVIDYDKMMDRTIKKKVGQYIAQGGLSWDFVMGMKSLAGVFA